LIPQKDSCGPCSHIRSPVKNYALAARLASGNSIPSWFVFGDKDKNIPPQTLAFMAERAKSKGTVVIKGGSHVAMISNPSAVVGLIKRAASTGRL